MGKIIGNTTATPNPRPDWNQTDENKADYIKNKPLKFVGSMELNGFSFDLSGSDPYASIGDMTAFLSSKESWELGEPIFYGGSVHSLVLLLKYCDIVYIQLHSDRYYDYMGNPIDWSFTGGIGKGASFVGDYGNFHYSNSLISYNDDGSASGIQFSGEILKCLIKWYDYDNWNPDNFCELSCPFNKFTIYGYRLLEVN